MLIFLKPTVNLQLRERAEAGAFCHNAAGIVAKCGIAVKCERARDESLLLRIFCVFIKRKRDENLTDCNLTTGFICTDTLIILDSPCKITYKMNTNIQVGILCRISWQQKLYMFDFFETCICGTN